MKILPYVIASKQNDFIKWASSLSDKKGRRQSEAFLAEGIKLTEEAARAGAPVTHVVIAEGINRQTCARVEAAFDGDAYRDTTLVRVSDTVFSRISTEMAPQGVLSIIKYLDFFKKLDIIDEEDFFLPAQERAMALCAVRDPGNLGSIMRSALAFGTTHLILSDDCADVYNPKTVRGAMGSLFRLRVTVVADLPACLRAARRAQRRVFSAELNGEAARLGSFSLRPTDIFVIGNEGHGVGAGVSAAADRAVYIPICEQTESLNAAVAAAVLMWEQNKSV